MSEQLSDRGRHHAEREALYAVAVARQHDAGHRIAASPQGKALP